MYISGDKHSVPWVDDLVAKHAPEGWKAYLYTPKRGKKRTGVYGHANWDDKVIEICVSNLEQTKTLTWIVLHEIGHAIHRASPRFVMPQLVRGRFPRGSLHPPEFWDIAIVLYESYGVVGPALENEYIMGRKRIRAHMQYNKRMAQARMLVSELNSAPVGSQV